MRGDLSRTSAADACRELARQAATGLLAIDGPDGPGSVSMIEGRIVAAASPTPRARLGDRLVGASYLDERELDAALQLQRSGQGHSRLGVLLVDRGLVSRDAVRLFVQEQMLDALFEVVRWRFGTFEFIAGEATEVQEVPLSISVDEILVEVARRQQEWEQVRQVIPDLEAVPTFRHGASSASAPLEPDEFAVLASVDGERSVRALAHDLGYGGFEAARIVYGLCLLGIVEILLPEDEVGAAFDDAFATPPEDGETRPEGEHGPLASEPDVDDELGGDHQPGVDDDLSHLVAELTGAREAAETAHEGGGEPTGDDPPVPNASGNAGSDEPEPFAAMLDELEDPTETQDAGDAERDTSELRQPSLEDAAAHQAAAPPPNERTPLTDEPEAVGQEGTGHWWDEPAPASGRDDAAWDEPAAGSSPAGDGDAPQPVGDDRHEPRSTDDRDAAQPVNDLSEAQPAEEWDEPQPTDDRDASHPADRDIDAPTQPPATEPEEPPVTEPEVVGQEEPPTTDPVEPATAATTEEPAGDEPSGTPDSGGDVSEFLRELSRLALDGDESSKPRPGVTPPATPPATPRRPKPREEEKPKKRGIFGWGS